MDSPYNTYRHAGLSKNDRFGTGSVAAYTSEPPPTPTPDSTVTYRKNVISEETNVNNIIAKLLIVV